MYKKVLYGALSIVLVFIISFIGYLGIVYAGDYVVDEKDLVMNSATSLVDEEGNEITKVFMQNRDLVDIKKIPEHVQQAFISVEDERFYEHHGVDARAISRALFTDIIKGGAVEGGSTITQQLAKNVFLTNEKTWLRKAKEAAIAIHLERKYSKKKILEMYLNQIYFGHGAYGIQAASHLFFNKDVSELTLEEGALLASIPKAPSSYSPIEHPDKAMKRRNLVLSLMERNNYISPEEAISAQGKTLALDIERQEKSPAYLTYVDMVLEEAKNRYSISIREILRGGYKIVVPMNKDAQVASFNEFKNPAYFKGSNKKQPPQGAFILMDNKDGGVLAVQGGRDYVRQGLNRVKVKRQPGSTFKPLAVYGPALEVGNFGPYSFIKDEKLDYNGYEPENYNDKYTGEITIYDAITSSANAPAVWLLNELGVTKSKKYLDELGIHIKDRHLGIALGGLDRGVTPMEMATAYRAFADGGKVVEPYFISKIYDREGNLVAKHEAEEKRVFSEQTAWSMTRMLQAVVASGTGQAGEELTEIAGKTGTTAYEKVEGANKDAWFVGYTPSAVGAVWIGYDRTTEEQYLTSGSGDATRLFKAIINQVPEQKALAFKKPEDVKDVEAPIRLKEIDDLSSKFVFGPFGIPSIKLSWTPSEDERLMYQIYMVTGDEEEKIASVIGEGEFVVTSVKLVGLPSFYIRSYNPQTEEVGEKSNMVEIELF